MTRANLTMHLSLISRLAAVVVCLILNAKLVANDLSFRRHLIDAESTYSACAVMDVNRDGRMDIVCGGWWYAAPTWKRHYLREVQMIRGRYDDYAHLPLDVNRDGWTDYVSANWRSQSIYWVQHPGRSLGAWTKHLIDTPGGMETARLVDVDGDGTPDVLPNCVRTADGRPFAAWWELATAKNATGRFSARWIRHELPSEVAGHGIGFGDINGDGRNDIVGSRGWLEAPPDRRTDRWIWHAEFDMGRDCSIPIIVQDVDADGDNDLIWGRGHNIGLFWMEQTAGDDRQREWQRHTIDTSWSQAHSLLLADLDNDDQPELIAGKRYLGHEGRDPGELDPLVAYWYRFTGTSRTWHRGVISPAGDAGFGLDPKANDVDGDGDVGVVGPGRSGLYWFENLLVGDGTPTATPDSPEYDDHSQLLVVSHSQGQSKSVESPAEWALRRSHVLVGMECAMGSLPPSSRRVPLAIRWMETVPAAKYKRHRITYASEPGDRVPAWLLVPENLTGPGPAMLCLHQTTRIGKDEPAGLGGRPTLHYAHELAERGYVCIVPDYPSFGDYEFDFKTQGPLYDSGSMKAIWNNLRAVDLLQSLPEVDHDRIGCIGHSLGGHNALFTATFDQRLRAVVTSCGFTAFHQYYGGRLAGWTSDRYMPRIRDQYGNDPDRVPFDFYEVIAALAPRPVFINAPLHDSNFDVTGVRKVVAEANKVYRLLGANDNLHVEYPDSEHDFPDTVRHSVYDWLDKKL